MYNLIVIGGGPGGYTAALEGASLGKRILLIERDYLGGVCLNSGCIPAKSLLNSSKIYKKSIDSEKFGVINSKTEFDLTAAMLWKNSSVLELKKSLTSLLLSRKIEIIKGEAVILNGNEVRVNSDIYRSEYIVIASGSRPFIPDIPGIDSAHVVTSREILDLKKLPDSISIIGGGVIGVEFASFFSSVGVKVSIVEMKSLLLPEMEERLGKIVAKNLNADIYLDSTVEKIDGDKVSFLVKGERKSLKSELILISVGREPDVDQFKHLGIVNNGAITVDDYLQTPVDKIYAVGDCTGKSFLAHGSQKMAVVAIENIFKSRKPMDYLAIPGVVYSEPEVAGVGLTVKKAKEDNIPVNKKILYLKTNGRYRVEGGNEDGICMILSHRESGRILGVHLAGSSVSEIITPGTIAVQKGYTVSEFREIVFPHPTLSEVLLTALQ